MATYATIQWNNGTSTWAISNNASTATDLTVGQDLVVTVTYISQTALQTESLSAMTKLTHKMKPLSE